MRFLALLLLLGGCADPIENHIAALVVNSVSAMEDRLNRGRTAGGSTNGMDYHRCRNRDRGLL